MGSQPVSPSSLKQKLKSSLCISGCFRQNNHHNGHHHGPDPSSPTSYGDKSSHIGSSPTLRDNAKVKSPRLTRTLSRSQDKCRSLIHRIGVGRGGGSGKHVRRHTADFHYDALSYALNFDRGCDDEDLDQFPLKNFSARLPQSPPSSPKTAESTSAAREFLAVYNVQR